MIYDPRPAIVVSFKEVTAELSVTNLRYLIGNVKDRLKDRDADQICTIVETELKPLLTLASAFDQWRPEDEWAIQKAYLLPGVNMTDHEFTIAVTRGAFVDGKFEHTHYVAVKGVDVTKNIAAWPWTTGDDSKDYLDSIDIKFIIIEHLTTGEVEILPTPSPIQFNENIPRNFVGKFEEIGVTVVGDFVKERAHIRASFTLSPELNKQYKVIGYVPELFVRVPPKEAVTE